MKSWPSRIGGSPVAGYLVAVGGSVAFAFMRELAEPWLHEQAALSPFVLIVVAAGALGLDLTEHGDAVGVGRAARHRLLARVGLEDLHARRDVLAKIVCGPYPLAAFVNGSAGG